MGTEGAPQPRTVEALKIRLAGHLETAILDIGSDPTELLVPAGRGHRALKGYDYIYLGPLSQGQDLKSTLSDLAREISEAIVVCHCPPTKSEVGRELGFEYDLPGACAKTVSRRTVQSTLFQAGFRILQPEGAGSIVRNPEQHIFAEKVPPLRNEKTAGMLGPATSIGTSIVVVTYNSATTLRECLESVLPTLSSDDELIIVDNASRDGTQAIVQDLIKQSCQARFVENSDNLGFSVASNIGLARSKGSNLVLLNPDTVVRPGWIDALKARFEDPNIGAVGPVSDSVSGAQYVEFHVPDSSDRSWTREQLARRLKDLHPGRSAETKLLIGFCLMFRRDLLNEVGLLDEDLFLGSDDLEICWRLRTNGYKLLIARDVFVEHRSGASFKSESEGKISALLEQSTTTLLKTLESVYGPGPLPTSRDLWDSEIFPGLA